MVNVILWLTIEMYGLIIFSDASWKLNCTYAGFFILFCNMVNVNVIL